MIKTLVALLSALALSACVIAPAKAMTKAEANKLQTQVISNSVSLSENGRNFCSGNIVLSQRNQKSGKVDTRVLTAKHCTIGMDHNKQFQISVPVYNKENKQVGTQEYQAVISSRYWGHDLALIKILNEDTLFENTAKIGKENIDMYFGRDVFSVGFPAGLSRQITFGNLGNQEYMNVPLNFGGTQFGYKYFQRTTPDTVPGNSGGGIFTQDESGNYVLVGVTSMGLRSGTHLNFSVPHNEIYKYLSRVTPIELE